MALLCRFGANCYRLGRWLLHTDTAPVRKGKLGHYPKTGTLDIGVRRFTPVGQEMHPNYCRARESTRKLRRSVWNDFGKAARLDGKSQRYSWIEMSVGTAACDRSENSRHHCKCPAGRNDEPTAALCFGASQKDARHNAVPQQNHNECPHEFAEDWRWHVVAAPMWSVHPVHGSGHSFLP